MKTLTFNTSGSNRLTDKIKRLLPGAYCTAAGLYTKRKTFTAYVDESANLDSVLEKLKALKVTSLKIT